MKCDSIFINENGQVLLNWRGELQILAENLFSFANENWNFNPSSSYSFDDLAKGLLPNEELQCLLDGHYAVNRARECSTTDDLCNYLWGCVCNGDVVKYEKKSVRNIQKEDIGRIDEDSHSPQSNHDFVKMTLVEYEVVRWIVNGDTVCYFEGKEILTRAPSMSLPSKQIDLQPSGSYVGSKEYTIKHGDDAIRFFSQFKK